MDELYFSPEFLELLELQMHMSDSTWSKIIATDPQGWAETLGANRTTTTLKALDVEAERKMKWLE